MRKLAVLNRIVVIFFFLTFFADLSAQRDTLPYNRKEEIVYDSKRYRKYNNYLTFGFGKGFSDVRRIDQSYINVDFQFHLQREYFQVGVIMSGDDFLRNNNLQGHLCYGYRIEKEKYNLAGFIGPSYSYFVTGTTDTAGVTTIQSHSVLGGYMCLSAVYKIKYDVGLGIELFGDISAEQKQAGARVVFFFSGAYRGIKRGFKTKPK
ncbi:MAG TPA: hypothetical protein PLC65_15160 [Bacteroidia bacterium]|nr:hypothetical protein [Bacteroidia bacterium]HRD39966.1 hypothetical protein [Bacteroidia bacterium]